MRSRRITIAVILLIGSASILFAGCLKGEQAATDTATTEKNTGMGKMADDMSKRDKIADEFKESMNPFRLEDGTGYDPEATTKGKEIFMANCTACHGEKGNGKGPSAEGLDPAPRDFTAVHLSTMDERQMITTISNGSPGTAMASFSSRFSIEERWQLISYLCTLNATKMCAPPGGAEGSNGNSSMPDNMEGMNH